MTDEPPTFELGPAPGDDETQDRIAELEHAVTFWYQRCGALEQLLMHERQSRLAAASQTYLQGEVYRLHKQVGRMGRRIGELRKLAGVNRHDDPTRELTKQETSEPTVNGVGTWPL